MKSVYTGGEKVAEFESYDELRIGDSNPAFIYEGNELVYPNPVKDGLVLWYDFSGRTNDDTQRDVAEDLSGNGNHGTLQNFNFTAESGYDKNKLLFDGVDDNIKTPSNLIGGLDSITISVTLKIISNVTRLDGFLMMGTGTGRVWIRTVGNQLSGNTYFGQSGLDFSTVFTNNALDNGIMNLIFVIDRRGKQIAYLNGSAISERDISEASDIPTHDGEIIIGRTSVGYSQPNADYYDVKIYRKVLTPEEIAHNYAIEKERFGIE